MLDIMLLFYQMKYQIHKKDLLYHKKEVKFFYVSTGGSADAQYLSAEFLVRLRPKINRRPLPVISLALDTSTIIAWQ